jgi:hypothetical protein
VKKWIWLGLLGFGAILLAWAFSESPKRAGPSSLSVSSSGWLAARRYWESSGAHVELLGRPLAQKNPKGTLVITFPEEGFRDKEEFDAILRHLSGGQALLIAFSGEGSFPLERLLWESVGAPLQSARGEQPLWPKQWLRFASEVWDLKPEPAAGAVRGVRVRAPRWAPQAPAGAEVFFRAPDSRPMIFQFAKGGGRVFVLPADSLSNSRLENPGNGDLLESLRISLGPFFTFDEFHHGFADGSASTVSSSVVPFDLLVLQLLLLYFLVVLALGRRFGTPWKEVPARAGSTAAFFLGLASRHRRLNHFRSAAELLVSRIRQYDASVSFPSDLDPATVTDEESFLAFSQSVARLASLREVPR